MKIRDMGWLFILLGILGIIIAVWFYLNQLLLDPKQASSANKNLAILSSVAGLISLSVGVLLPWKSRGSGGEK